MGGGTLGPGPPLPAITTETRPTAPDAAAAPGGEGQFITSKGASTRRSQPSRPPSPSGNPSTLTPAPPREGRNAGSAVLFEKPPKPLVQSKAHILTKHSTSHSLQNLYQDSVLELLEDERPQLREGRVTSAYAGSREWSKFTTLTIDHSLTTRVFSTTSFTCFRFSEAASQSFTMKTFFNKLEKLTGVDLDGDGTIGGTQQCKGIATMHWRV